MSISAFGPWPESVHSSPDQLKRIKSAQSADVTPDSIDVAAQSCTIKGSGKKPYTVTLSSCTCNDFSRRHLPCKHIYRLAAELGLIDLPVKSGASKGNQFTLEEAISALEALSPQAQQYVQRFLYASNGYGTGGDPDARFSVPASALSDELKLCPLLLWSDASLSQVLETFKKNQLLDVCACIPVSPAPKKNASKAALSEWILQHAGACTYDFPAFITFSFSPNFRRFRREVYSYLLRKFDSESLLDERGLFRCPHGAVWHNDGRYYFPDDKITALLTLYGHNRCLNGFVPEYE